jgi:DNA-binding response OmpR family regulator
MCVYAETQKRIIIVDDDVDLLMLLERRLVKEGYEIETAASLSEAQEILPYFSPHLLLLDININGEDGRKLCWQIKKSNEQKEEIKVMIMSGYDYDTGRSVLFGADELLAKPLHIDFLLHRIRFHLGLESTAVNITPLLKTVEEQQK